MVKEEKEPQNTPISFLYPMRFEGNTKVKIQEISMLKKFKNVLIRFMKKIEALLL